MLPKASPLAENGSPSKKPRSQAHVRETTMDGPPDKKPKREVEEFKAMPYDVTKLQSVGRLVVAAREELMDADREGRGPDDGALLERTRLALLELGIDDPSFARQRLGPKPAGAVVPCCKLLALCPMKREDLEGDSKSGQALRAAFGSLGLVLSGPPSADAPYPVHVLWRNLRGRCWRKHDDSGCHRPSGTELQLLDLLDRLWNICVERGGWHIVSVVAMSKRPAEVTMNEGGELLSRRGYVGSPHALETAHPIDLACEGRQRKGEDRVETASAILLDLCVAIAATAGHDDEEDLTERAEDLYEAVHATPYFLSRTYELEDLEQGPSAARAAAMASECARANGIEGGPGKGVMPAMREQARLKERLQEEGLEEEEMERLQALLKEQEAKEAAGRKKKSKDASVAGAASLGASRGANGTQKGTGYVEAEYKRDDGKLIGVYALAQSGGKGRRPTDFISQSEVPLSEEEIISTLNEKYRGYYRWTRAIPTLQAAPGGRIVRRLTEKEEKVLRGMTPANRSKLQGWEKQVAGEFKMVEGAEEGGTEEEEEGA